MMARSQPLPVVFFHGCRRILAECGRCGTVRPLVGRGLCNRCVWDTWADGTRGEYGYVKADRLAEFARYRLAGVGVGEAARRVCVSGRTGWRYEAELAASGCAPWREWSCRAA
jgi:hypothetical protein